MTQTQNGLGKLWIVDHSDEGEHMLADILFQTTPRELALQIKGGLEPDEILGWFDQAWEANQIALQELYRAGAMMFRIMCRVSGGMTGTREAYLKADGVVQEFDTREAAQAKADELMQKMNHAYSVADFRYWVEEMGR